MKDIALIDLGIILFLLFFVIKGYQQGLIRQTLALVGLLLGLKIASDNFLYASTLVQTYLDLPKSVANLVGFVLILAVVVLVANLIGWTLSGLTKVLLLSFVDRLIGAGVGLIQGGILVYLIVLLVSKVPYQGITHQIDKSVLAKDLLALTPYIEENLDRIIRQ